MIATEILQVLMAIVGFFGVFILNDLKKSVEKATDSVNELNQKVSVIIEKSERHDKEIDALKENDEKFHEKLNDISQELSTVCRVPDANCPIKSRPTK